MENPKKLILFIVLLLIVSCQQNLKKCQECETDKDSLIFVDKKNNEVYVKLKAVERHPKLEEELKANHYYNFYNSVHIYFLNKNVPLGEIIDQKSFKRINDCYFEDSNFIYFTPHIPTGDYFNILDRKENVKFSTNKDTIYSRYGNFYKGVLITGY
jgi:hypothetical protein